MVPMKIFIGQVVFGNQGNTVDQESDALSLLFVQNYFAEHPEKMSNVDREISV